MIRRIMKKGVRKGLVEVMFKYKDKYTDGRWNSQKCVVESVDKCIELYGLGVDCEYKIISVKEVSKNE